MRRGAGQDGSAGHEGTSGYAPLSLNIGRIVEQHQARISRAEAELYARPVSGGAKHAQVGSRCCHGSRCCQHCQRDGPKAADDMSGQGRSNERSLPCYGNALRQRLGIRINGRSAEICLCAPEPLMFLRFFLSSHRIVYRGCVPGSMVRFSFSCLACVHAARYEHCPRGS